MIRPSSTEHADAGGHVDWAGSGPILAPMGVLAAALVPAWALWGTSWIADFAAQMLSPRMLPALGLLLAVRRGSFDFSVWAGFALGGAVAAAVLAGGHGPVSAMLAGAAAGAALGAVGGSLVLLGRLPGWAATLISALLAAGAAALAAPPAPVAAADGRMIAWTSNRTIALLVLGCYAATVMEVLAQDRLAPQARGGRAGLAGALFRSGVLSAMGGVCWLMKRGEVPAGAWYPEDLRPLAAVVVTGAVLLRGGGMTALAGVLLPPAMLLATIWKYLVWDVRGGPFDLNAAVLIVAVLGAQWSGRAGRVGPGRRRLMRELSAGLPLLGLAMIALTAALPRRVGPVFRWGGAAVWLGAIAWVLGLQARSGAGAVRAAFAKLRLFLAKLKPRP